MQQATLAIMIKDNKIIDFNSYSKLKKINKNFTIL